MSIRIFNARKVAESLHRGEVSARDRAYYLMASFLVLLPFFYFGLVDGNPPASWLNLYEVFAVVVITVIGFVKVYEAAGGDSNPEFVAQFTCLWVPVAVTTMIAVCAAYWGIALGFREGLIALSRSNLQISASLYNIGSDFFGLLIFLAAALTQVIVFYRIWRLFHVVRR